MSEFNWRAVVERIKNGEPVSEKIANRALVALMERTDWLKNRLEQLDTTSGKLTLTSAEIDSSVQGGDWVYYDPTDDVYKPALAVLDFDDDLNAYLPGESSFVTGLVIDKISGTQATILVVAEGIDLPAEPDIANMQSMVQGGETFRPGRYFLSNTDAGKMTQFPANAPLIPLGVFDTESSTVRPDIRDAFDSHYHRRFELHAVPGSSQNLAESGWAHDGTIAWVDHYYLAGEPSSIVALAHRRNATKVPSKTPQRVDFCRDAGTGKLNIKVHKVYDPEDPASEDPNAIVKVVEWPNYGEEIVVDWPEDGIETDLIVAFMRRDWNNVSRYAAPLEQDVNVDLPPMYRDGVWKVNLPHDFKGWANANPFRDEVPATARLRYISEGQLDLFASFPPIPVEGARVFKDGAVAIEDTDYVFSYFDLFWVDNSRTADPATSGYPWPHDFDRDSPFSEKKDVQISFVENPLGPTESVVRCLTSVSDLLKITQLGGDQKASTGKLQIALALALAIRDGDPITADTVLASIDEDSKFILGTSVAELVAGPNTKLVKINNDGSENEGGPFTGKVRVEAVLPTLQGETVGVALFNAKESERNSVIYTEFLPPDNARTALAARIKVPNFDRGSNHIRFRLYATFLGEVTSAGSSAGIFKVEYRIARPGVNLSTGLAAPSRTEAWRVPFTGGYVPFTILDNELPVYGDAGSETFEKEPAASIFNLYADDLLEPNDIISVRIERMANDAPFQVGDAGGLTPNGYDGDDYAGSIGIVGLRWTIDLTS